MPYTFGQTINLTCENVTGLLPLTTVWEFWDGEVRTVPLAPGTGAGDYDPQVHVQDGVVTTARAVTVAKVANRAGLGLPYTVTIVDGIGRSLVRECTVDINDTPQLIEVSIQNNDAIMRAAGVPITITARWRDKIHNLGAATASFVYSGGGDLTVPWVSLGGDVFESSVSTTANAGPDPRQISLSSVANQNPGVSSYFITLNDGAGGVTQHTAQVRMYAPSKLPTSPMRQFAKAWIDSGSCAERAALALTVVDRGYRFCVVDANGLIIFEWTGFSWKVVGSVGTLVDVTDSSTPLLLPETAKPGALLLSRDRRVPSAGDDKGRKSFLDGILYRFTNGQWTAVNMIESPGRYIAGVNMHICTEVVFQQVADIYGWDPAVFTPSAFLVQWRQLTGALVTKNPVFEGGKYVTRHVLELDDLPFVPDRPTQIPLEVNITDNYAGVPSVGFVLKHVERSQALVDVRRPPRILRVSVSSQDEPGVEINQIETGEDNAVIYEILVDDPDGEVVYVQWQIQYEGPIRVFDSPNVRISTTVIGVIRGSVRVTDTFGLTAVAAIPQVLVKEPDQ